MYTFEGYLHLTQPEDLEGFLAKLTTLENIVVNPKALPSVPVFTYEVALVVSKLHDLDDLVDYSIYLNGKDSDNEYVGTGVLANYLFQHYLYLDIMSKIAYLSNSHKSSLKNYLQKEKA